MNLSEAQASRRARGEMLAEERCIALADALCDALQLAGSSGVKNYQLVGPEKRKKLSGLINHYRKMAHPFTACVRDNTKRFGPERAKKVCAVLTDLEKNTTKWRSGGRRRGTSMSLSEVTTPAIDGEMFDLLAALGSIDYAKIMEAS